MSAESWGTICLVFDAIFALIFALSGLNASAYSAETLCYEENGYSWHNILVVISVPEIGFVKFVFPSHEKSSLITSWTHQESAPFLNGAWNRWHAWCERQPQSSVAPTKNEGPEGCTEKFSETKALSFIISAVFAAWGMLLHGAVVISGEGAPMKAAQLVGVSRYGHILVAWTCLSTKRKGDCLCLCLCKAPTFSKLFLCTMCETQMLFTFLSHFTCSRSNSLNGAAFFCFLDSASMFPSRILQHN